MKVKSESEVAQSCPTLSDPMDCSLLGSSVHGIFQARVLEWGAIAFSDICYRLQLWIDTPLHWQNILLFLVYEDIFIKWHFGIYQDLLEKGMSTDSSILAWKIPWMGAWRVTVHGVTNSWTRLSTHTCSQDSCVSLFLEPWIRWINRFGHCVLSFYCIAWFNLLIFMSSCLSQSLEPWIIPKFYCPSTSV